VDTTATTISYILWALATNPESMRKLQAELDQAMEDPRRVLGIDVLTELPYLNAVINEGASSSLRGQLLQLTWSTSVTIRPSSLRKCCYPAPRCPRHWDPALRARIPDPSWHDRHHTGLVGTSTGGRISQSTQVASRSLVESD